jgi:hypothetical protein
MEPSGDMNISGGYIGLEWRNRGIISSYLSGEDCLCGLVVIVPGYRSRGPDSIPGATRFPEKQWFLNGGPLSLLSTTEELLGRKNCGFGLESREYVGRDPSR